MIKNYESVILNCNETSALKSNIVRLKLNQNKLSIKMFLNKHIKTN